MEGFWQELRSAVLCLLGIGVLFLLGTTGLWVRQGVETKKALRKVRADAANKGLGANEKKWRALNRKATLQIWGPIVGWLLAYGAFFFLLPGEYFSFSLLGLIAPLLGYFGIRFVPGAD